MTLPSSDVFLSPGELGERLEEVTVVDVRPAADYEELGHVPGAVNVPFESIRDPGSVTPGMLPEPEEFAMLLGDVGIEPADDVVTYDGDRGVYAARFLVTAAVYGHRGDLAVLDGDYSVWREEHATSTELPAREGTDYAVDPSANPPIADRSDVRRAADDDDAVLVDTRTAAEYEQSHIPGAVQLGWEDLVGDDRRLKPREEIEAILADRGITRDRSIVLYCNTARRLSHTYAVLRELGYRDLSFYEGSLTDWIRAEAPEWDPIGLRERIRDLAGGGFERVVGELGDDVLNRLKLIGLYHQRQEGYFMLRTKVPGGILTAEQARTVGEVADEFARAPEAYGGVAQNPVFGDGFLDVTTRQDVQMHWIRIEDVPEIWDRYEAVGLTTLQACGNSVRNVVGCPAAGIDADEAVAVGEIADEVTDRFLGDRTYANLPRKLKVSVTGCRENCARAHINDLGFVPSRKDGREGFHVLIGGGLSDGPRMASDLDVFVGPERVVELVEATADLFVEYGSYLDTAVNRLRFLVEELGIERVREELDRRTDFPFESAGEGLTEDYRGDHVGVHEQADGRRYVGLNVPTGRMLGSELAELAALAERYGDGEVRLTLNQNVLLPHVPADDVGALREEPLLDRYEPDPGPFARGIVTCTGREFCSYGVIETKNRAIRWVRTLDEWADEADVDLPAAVRIHVSGCSASCAQPQLGDVGLRGETYRDETGSREGVDVGLGGDLGREQFADWVATAVPAETVPDRVRELVTEYADSEAADFAAWANGTPHDDLARLVTSGDRLRTQEAD